MTDYTPLTDEEIKALRKAVSEEYRIADMVYLGALLATIDALADSEGEGR